MSEKNLQTVGGQRCQRFHNSKLKEKILCYLSQCNFREIQSITKRVYDLKETKYAPRSKVNTVQKSLAALIKEGKVLRIRENYFKTSETDNIKEAIKDERARIFDCERELYNRLDYYSRLYRYLERCMELINHKSGCDASIQLQSSSAISALNQCCNI